MMKLSEIRRLYKMVEYWWKDNIVSGPREWARKIVSREIKIAQLKERLEDTDAYWERQAHLARYKHLEAAVKYAKTLCYKHSNGDDACHCELYDAALGVNEKEHTQDKIFRTETT